MKQRHGWSAPWLPGLWLMPDGSRFGDASAPNSLLLSLQLYFEKEAGVQWKCPHGIACAEGLRAQRRAQRERRRSLVALRSSLDGDRSFDLDAAEAGGRLQRSSSVHIAERGSRVRVHNVPGFSEATARCLPTISTLANVAAGSLTWERMWTDSDGHVKVIQARVPVATKALLARHAALCWHLNGERFAGH